MEYSKDIILGVQYLNEKRQAYRKVEKKRRKRENKKEVREKS